MHIGFTRFHIGDLISHIGIHYVVSPRVWEDDPKDLEPLVSIGGC